MHAIYKAARAGGLLMALTGSAAMAAPAYSILDLGLVGGGSPEALQINEAGQVIGNQGGQAFIWQAGVRTNLGAAIPGAMNTVAQGLNDQGDVVGYYRTSDVAFYTPVLWRGGVATTLSVPTSGGPLNIGATAQGINNAGVVVGGGGGGAFVWKDGQVLWQTQPSLSSFSDINNAGQAVGTTAQGTTLWQNGQPTALDGYWSPHAISDTGIAVGTRSTNSGREAVSWRDGVLTVLASTAPNTDAEDVNSSGVIVGTTFEANSVRAVLWRDGQLLDLNDLAESGGAGWVLSKAYGINDAGWIVGAGVIEGEIHAYLLTPVPEPATIALTAIGLLGAAGMSRLRRAKG